ncbi:MAG: cystathionine beta-synthase [Actinomycetota bacterium]|nr:cystathionine beta-synthase [Actinomycetota bacterium]
MKLDKPAVHESLLDLVGNTPLLRLGHVGRGLAPELLAKVELLNPGGSVKDRIGIRMIESAERAGLLRPGGTIVEPTSGNTGVGLAIAASLKGYRCIFTMPDKMSQEKITLLRAYGAEVVIAPTSVPPESPQSYYRVADRLAEEIPGAFQPNQYANQQNPLTHYETTGPEIWEQTEGRITHFVAGVGTGGTITGVARYLKERNRAVVIVGADPKGSLYTGEHPHPYLTEGIGEDFWPESFDPSVVDHWVTVSDRDSLLTARRIAREEGLLVGESCGSAVFAALSVARDLSPTEVVVVILPDTGRNYLSKLYNDTWMLQNGFMEPPGTQARIGQVLARKRRLEPHVPDLVVIGASDGVGRAIEMFQSFGISQLPVAATSAPEDLSEIVGSIRERSLLDRLFRDPSAVEREVSEVMDPPLPVLESTAGVEAMFADLSRGAEAVVVVDGTAPAGVLTRADLLDFLAHQAAD